MAVSGDLSAIKEILDRLEGKPRTQNLIIEQLSESKVIEMPKEVVMKYFNSNSFRENYEHKHKN